MTAHTIVLIWFFRVFFPSFLDLFSIYKVSTISAPTRSLPFLSFIVPIFGQNVPLIFQISLKRSLVFPLQMVSSFIHCSLKKVFLSLHTVIRKSELSWICLSLLFSSLLALAICEASSDDRFAFLLLFFFGMVLFAASCTVLWTSAHSYLGTLSTRSNPLNLFVTPTVQS